MQMYVKEKAQKTPLVKLDDFGGLSLHAKLGNTNPTGTIKYRTALRMIEDAERSGQLRGGMRIIEHTSGNTGIALAYIGQELGYPVIIVVGSRATPDSKRMIKEYGAELVNVDGFFIESEKKVKEIMSSSPEKYYWPNQVANKSSLESNKELGKEIADELAVDIFMASIGTGSTITGVGSALKRIKPDVLVYLVLPDGEYEYSGVGDKENTTVPLPLYDPDIVDKRIRIKETEAIEAAKKLYRDYGHYVGVSSGAVFAAAEKINESGNAVIIFMDKGDRYTHVLGEE